MSVHLGQLGHRNSGFHVYCHNARNALLLHRHTDQLLGHFHGDLVVTDEQELGFFAHALDQLGITFGVAIVKRCINLIQQTKWC